MRSDPKCKGPQAVSVISVPGGGDPVGVWTVTYLMHGACRNVAGYADELYVLTRNDRLGMQLLPELAVLMPAMLRDQTRVGPSVRIRHKRFKLWWPYATLTAAAALALADAIEAALV